jgi:quinol monooxygenase YgiN
MAGEFGAAVTIKVLPGKEKEFEERFAEQANNVRKIEKGNLLYKLYKHRTEPSTYVVMEIYENAAAVEFHQKNGHMDLTRPGVRALIDGPMVSASGDGV